METALSNRVPASNQAIPDLVDLDTAAKIAGRSPKTIRTWVREGVLEDRRTPGDTRGRLLVSTRELLAHLSGTTPLPASVEHPRVPEAAADQSTLVAVLERELEELRTDKRRLTAEVESLRGELRDSRRLVEDLRQAKAAVERELNGGVRGLLRRLF